MNRLILLIFTLLGNASEATDGRYALVVGINGYPHFQPDRRLKYADKDAKLFADFLSSAEGGGFPKENIKLLLNQNADRVSIIKGIQWLQLRTSNNDTVYVFFAGHGVVNDLGQVYLMPYDAEPSFPDALGIPAKDVFGMVKQRVGYKNLVFFIDACHAGATLSNGTSRSEVAVASELQTTWKSVRSKQSGVDMALLSASSTQQSWEDGELGHGLFTWYLIDALRGAASDKAGIVRMGQAYRYVLDRVEERSRAKFASVQSPTISAGYDPNFVLSITKPPIDPARGYALTSLREGIDTTIKNMQTVRALRLDNQKLTFASYEMSLNSYKANEKEDAAGLQSLGLSAQRLSFSCERIENFYATTFRELDYELSLWNKFRDLARKAKVDYPPISDWNEMELELSAIIGDTQDELKRWTKIHKEEKARRFCPPKKR